ncbi:MAG: RNA polymerase sigma factor, partial [Planctomycetaceae bacterium]
LPVFRVERMNVRGTTMNAGRSRQGGSTSRSLLARLKENEPDAWERLVRLYAPLVVHWCRTLHLPEQDVADVLQDVFQSVALHIGGFRKERTQDTLRGWLRTITRNKVRDHFRRQRREPTAAGGSGAQWWFSQVPIAHPHPDAEDATESAVESDLYRRALDLIRSEFEERTWRAFWRVVVDGLTPKEVGEELSMRPGTVRVAKARVLHRLRQELGDLTDG